MEQKLEEAIQEYLIAKKMTLSLAESCTGGALSAALTVIPGASNYFLGSVVAYANTVKEDLLKVKHQTLLEKGAVSQETAIEMALGALHFLRSDFSIAVTGVAGPSGGTLVKPVGTVCFAICGKDGVIHEWTVKIIGNRETIIKRSTYEALNMFQMKVCRGL